MHVTYFFRQPQPGFHSIEELFATVIAALPSKVEATRYSVPRAGAAPASLLANTRAARVHRNRINHVTGHINYVVPALGRRTILTVHDVGSSFTGGPIRNMLVRLLWYWLPAFSVKRITVVSAFSRSELGAVIPFAEKKIHVVHNPCSPKVVYQNKTFDSEKPRILHVGTKPNKNLDRTARALRGIPCTLVIVGVLSEAQKHMLASCGIDVENHRDLTYDAMLSLYAGCDLLCFASTYEGFGMPVIEANGIGRPVVTGRAASIPEVANDAACLVNPYDPDAIRAGVLRIIQEPGYRETLIRNGLTNVERFRPEKIAGHYVRLYREICD